MATIRHLGYDEPMKIIGRAPWAVSRTGLAKLVQTNVIHEQNIISNEKLIVLANQIDVAHNEVRRADLPNEIFQLK